MTRNNVIFPYVVSELIKATAYSGANGADRMHTHLRRLLVQVMKTSADGELPMVVAQIRLYCNELHRCMPKYMIGHVIQWGMLPTYP